MERGNVFRMKNENGKPIVDAKNKDLEKVIILLLNNVIFLNFMIIQQMCLKDVMFCYKNSFTEA